MPLSSRSTAIKYGIPEAWAGTHSTQLHSRESQMSYCGIAQVGIRVFPVADEAIWRVGMWLEVWSVLGLSAYLVTEEPSSPDPENGPESS